MGLQVESQMLRYLNMIGPSWYPHVYLGLGIYQVHKLKCEPNCPCTANSLNGWVAEGKRPEGMNVKVAQEPDATAFSAAADEDSGEPPATGFATSRTLQDRLAGYSGSQAIRDAG